MSYIGNQPLVGFYNTVVDLFSGDGTTVTFTLSQIPPSKESVIITIDGVLQHLDAYGIISDQLTFTGIPENGVSIEVLYIGIN